MVQNGRALAVKGNCVVSVKVHKAPSKPTFKVWRGSRNLFASGASLDHCEAFEPCGEPKSLTFTAGHLACLISINTPLYDKHVYHLTANIRQSDAMRCCFSNEDTGAFIKASRVPQSETCLFYTHIKKHLYKEKKPNYLL